MKTLIISAFFLSLTNLTVAQNNEYLKKVSAEKNAKQIEQLQKKAAHYDIEKLAAFEKNIESTYTIVFENPNGEIVATYNHKGQILKTVEEYKNIKSPKKVRVDLLRNYSEWFVVSNVLKISYSTIKDVEKTLGVKIEKDGETQMVFFDLNQKKEEALFVKN